MLKYLPKEYYQRLLGQEPREMDSRSITIINQRLAPFGLDKLEDQTEVVQLPLPDNFGTITEELNEAYASYDNRWVRMMELVDSELPETPKAFNCPRGWSVWGEDSWLPCSAPSALTMIVDMETTNIGDDVWFPTCAVCVDAYAWYVWKADFGDLRSTVPFEGHNTVLGYNVSYDRSYMSCEYKLEDSQNALVDLMSMWIVTNGMSNQQRTVFAGTKSDDDDEDQYDLGKPGWISKTSTNGLASAYEFYTKRQLDKGVRDNIVDGGLQWSADNMSEVIRYCVADVIATHELAKYLVPAYMQHRPSKVNRYGAIALGSCWVPLSADRFPGFYDRVEQVYQSKKVKLNDMLMTAATAYLETETCNALNEHLDWTLAASGKNKGLPMWYRKCLSEYRKGNLSLSQRFAPTILGMTWLGSQLRWNYQEKGWQTLEHGMIPHPTKRGQAVASMFLKDFANLHDTDAIGSSNEYTKGVVKEKASTINWVSQRKRVKGIRTESPDGIPVTIPMMSVNGTITGRATDPVWMVLPNPKANRIGTELKSMVEAFPGYKLVGADVSSEEAWLAGCYGDQDMGFCASTPFGAINAMGTSATRTDIHSMVADSQTISRDVAKVLNYGTIYGAGVKGNADVLLKNDPTMATGVATAKAKAFIEHLKGAKNWETGEYKDGLASHSFTAMEQRADRRMPFTPLTGAKMSNALAGVADYKPTRVNWCIQASGSDFRDMMVLLGNHFLKKLKVNARLVITIHDEFHWQVADADTVQAVYALQLAHLYVRMAFILAHKLDNLPASVAWFEAVEVDQYLRKDCKATCQTPTQEPLTAGYSLTAKTLMELL